MSTLSLASYDGGATEGGRYPAIAHSVPITSEKSSFTASAVDFPSTCVERRDLRNPGEVRVDGTLRVPRLSHTRRRVRVDGPLGRETGDKFLYWNLQPIRPLVENSLRSRVRGTKTSSFNLGSLQFSRQVSLFGVTTVSVWARV